MPHSDTILTLIGVVLAIATILNTISRWSAVRELVSKYQEREIQRLDKEIQRLAKNIHELRNYINTLPLNFVVKQDFHAESNKLWRAIRDNDKERSERENNG